MMRGSCDYLSFFVWILALVAGESSLGVSFLEIGVWSYLSISLFDVQLVPSLHLIFVGIAVLCLRLACVQIIMQVLCLGLFVCNYSDSLVTYPIVSYFSSPPLPFLSFSSFITRVQSSILFV